MSKILFTGNSPLQLSDLLFYEKVIVPGAVFLNNDFAINGEFLELASENKLILSPNKKELSDNDFCLLIDQELDQGVKLKILERIRLKYERDLYCPITTKYALGTTLCNKSKENYTSCLKVTMLNVPYIDRLSIGSNEFIDFLIDNETKIKRRRFYKFFNELEFKIEKGDYKIEHVPDLIATTIDDYKKYLELSKQKFRYGVYQKVFFFTAHIISALTIVNLPSAIKSLLDFGKEHLELKKEELYAPGRELAFLSDIDNLLNK